MTHRFAAGFVACVLAAGTLAPALAATPVAAVKSAPAKPSPTKGLVPPVSFPQEHSDQKPDPEVRYGRLPNGFTYVIRKNATPAGTASIILRVRAGSMMETDKQRGLAHFIEHMAFKGTAHIPEGELRRTLERHGFTFGADANAFTSDAKTIYVLSAPKTDAETVDTALFILREVAGNITFDPDAIDRERGVVLGEERARDKPAYHAAVGTMRWLFAGQRFADYSQPIGQVATLQGANRADLTAFYDTWYRPELATLVVVGDIDPDQVEAKIKADFADWKGKGPMPAEPDWGTYTPKGLRAFTYSEKDLTDSLMVAWIKALDTSHDSQTKRVGVVEDNILTGLLNIRFRNRQAQAGAAFLSAKLDRATAFKTGRYLTLSITPRPGKARQAFEQVYDVLHTFLDQGVTTQEIGDVATEIATEQKNLVAADKTRTSDSLASSLLSYLDSDTVFNSTQDALATYDAVRPHINQADLNARLKMLFAGDGPALVHTGDSLGDFDETELKADYAAISGLPAAAYAEKVRKPWAYADFGPAAAPVSHTVDKDFGYGRYVYGNGVILNVKPTKLKNNEILVQVDYPGGLLRFDPKADRPYALPLGSIFIGGGLGKMTEADMRDSLWGKRVSYGYGLSDKSAIMVGTTTPEDLALQLQILTAYAVDPGYRPGGFNTERATADEVLKSDRATPAGVLKDNFQRLIRSGDRRYDLSVRERLKDMKFDDVRSLMADSLKDTPIVVTIVGDVDESQAVTEVGRTFATLPARPATAPVFPGADQLAFPPQQRDFTLYHEGRDDQSLSVALWPTVGYYVDTRESRTLSVLGGVLNNRINDDLREKQGAVYSPEAHSSQDSNFATLGYIEALATMKAGGDQGFRDSLSRIVADLKTNPVGNDELLRVKTPLLESIVNQDKDNKYWLRTLTLMELYGDKARGALLRQRAEYEAVTADDVLRAARKYLNDDTMIHIKVLPDPTRPPAPSAMVLPLVKPAAAPPPIPVPPTAKP